MAGKSTIEDKLKRVKIALIFIFISLVGRIIFDVLLALNNFKLLKEIIELIFTGQITAEDPVAAVAEFVLFLIIFGILFAVFLIPTIVWLIYYIQTLVNASSDKKTNVIVLLSIGFLFPIFGIVGLFIYLSHLNTIKITQDYEVINSNKD